MEHVAAAAAADDDDDDTVIVFLRILSSLSSLAMVDEGVDSAFRMMILLGVAQLV
jgi:hypothetical protein